jgi:hypothetical protein
MTPNCMDNQYCILGEILGGVRRVVVTIATTRMRVEAERGVEPR